MDMIEAKCSEMVETLNKANRKGLVSREILVKLRECHTCYLTMRTKCNASDYLH